MRPILTPLAGILLALPLPAQAPGLHTLKVGDLAVTCLQDGQQEMPTANVAQLLKGMEPGEVARRIGGPSMTWTYNAFLVRMKDRLVLVDTGFGPDGQARNGGRLQERLQAAGVDPASIDLVLITHFHGDHVGGLLKADGTRAFPRAVLRASAEEDAFWSDPAKLPERLREGAATVRKVLAPYRAAGAYKPFAAGEDPAPGIKAVPSHGHTGGHTCYAFASRGQEIWFVGDLFHVAPVQFGNPEVAVGFDADIPQAVASRKAVFQMAARRGFILAAAHLAFPGLVRLEAEGTGFKALPAER